MLWKHHRCQQQPTLTDIIITTKIDRVRNNHLAMICWLTQIKIIYQSTLLRVKLINQLFRGSKLNESPQNPVIDNLINYANQSHLNNKLLNYASHPNISPHPTFNSKRPNLNSSSTFNTFPYKTSSVHRFNPSNTRTTTSSSCNH